MIAIFGGENVRCARYETFGTKKLANAAIKALVGRNACLLANHGLISTQYNLSSAYDIVIELEEMCKQYLVATKMGKLKLLSKQEMASVIKKFKVISLQILYRNNQMPKELLNHTKKRYHLGFFLFLAQYS